MNNTTSAPRTLCGTERTIIACEESQRVFADADQQQVDRVCAALVEAALADAARLGHLAHVETGYGNAAHKTLKNQFAARNVWDSIKGVRTVGVIAQDIPGRVSGIATPVGLIAAILPSTNPTSTVIYKALIAIKARNGIIFSPHPRAQHCSRETARILGEAGEAAGMPRGLIGCLPKASVAATRSLMEHPAISLVVATGGAGRVKAALTCGKPAITGGPANVPAYVDRSADVTAAARAIVDSKAFDCSVICSTEQAVVADRVIAGELRQRMHDYGAHWLDAGECVLLAARLFRPDGTPDPELVGKTPQQLASLIGTKVPSSARVLVADLSTVGPDQPLSREKLTTVLGFYTVDDVAAAAVRCTHILQFGGLGHSMVIHANDPAAIDTLAMRVPAFRILVNTPASLGAIGATTDLAPALTLAPGCMGGAITSDNITATHLLNTKRIAHSTRPRPPMADDDRAVPQLAAAPA
jgi:acetaldehyde dehydrogenase (acetylating)